MKSVKVVLDNLKFDHALWLNELYFSKKEIAIYEERLLKLMKEYFGKEGQEELGVILNDLVTHRKSVKHITEQIEHHIKTIEIKTASNGSLKSLLDSDHSKTREMMEYFRGSYSKLKRNFHRFAAFQD